LGEAERERRGGTTAEDAKGVFWESSFVKRVQFVSGELPVEEGDFCLVGFVGLEAEVGVELEGSGHVGCVGVENGAGEASGGDAGEDLGDELAGQALAAECGEDEEALDLAGVGAFMQIGAVGDAGGGGPVDVGEEEFALVVGVGGGEDCDLLKEVGVVEVSAGVSGLEEVAVGLEEGDCLGLERRGA
jgi:hypothetical protein